MKINHGFTRIGQIRHFRLRVLKIMIPVIIILSSAAGYAEGIFSIHGSAEWDLTISESRDTILNMEGYSVNEMDDALWFFINPEVSTDEFKFYSGLRIQKSLVYNTNASVFFDQAYFNWNMSDRAYLNAGKRRLPMGYSYFWSPSFIVNPNRYAFDPELYSEGIPIFVLGYTGDYISPKFIWVIGSAQTGAEIKMEDSYFVLQADFYLSGFECFVNGLTSRSKEQTIGLGLRKDIFGFTLHAEGSVVKNNQKKYFYDPASLGAGDTIYYNTRENDWQPVLAAGFNKLLFGDGFIIVEYYYDKTGFNKNEFDNFRSSVEYFGNKAVTDTNPYYAASLPVVAASYAPGSMQQNYLFISYSHAIKQKWNVGLRGLVSLEDGSGFVYPSVYYQPFDNFQIGAEYCCPFYGSADSEFGILPFNHLTVIKVKAFF